MLLKNLQEFCPSIYKSIRNSSKSRTSAFIDKVLSNLKKARTTNCDPKVTPMYGVAILLLIDMPEFQSWARNETQVAGSFKSLQDLVDKLNEHCDLLGLIVMNYHLKTNRNFFKSPTNRIFLELDDDVIEAQFVLGVFVGF